MGDHSPDVSGGAANTSWLSSVTPAGTRHRIRLVPLIGDVASWNRYWKALLLLFFFSFVFFSWSGQRALIPLLSSSVC